MGKLLRKVSRFFSHVSLERETTERQTISKVTGLSTAGSNSSADVAQSTSNTVIPYLKEPAPASQLGEKLVPQNSRTTNATQTTSVGDRWDTSGGCPTCLDLDLRRISSNSDGLSTHSWAREEYVIDSRTAAGVIKLQNAHALIQSVQSGCPYCTVLTLTLDQIEQIWRHEECFLEVFVARDLPVVLRLRFGATMVKSDYHSPQHHGVGLPMKWTMSIMPKGKPQPDDIEIYRARHDKIKTSTNPVIEQAITFFNSRIGCATHAHTHSGEDINFDMINTWLATCLEQHRTCNNWQNEPVLPDRAIWLNAPTRNRIKLIETQGARARYVTLSYCWGAHTEDAGDVYLTTRSNLEQRKDAMNYDDLPPLFIDAVDICRRLGLQYLWIDRLCIIQGADGDFAEQAPKMGDIYGRSSFTIAAASAQSENDHILHPRDRKWASHQLSLRVAGSPLSDVYFRRRHVPLGSEQKGGLYGRLSTRAWIWQERLLSTRTLFYTTAGLKFECRQSSFWEGFDVSHVGHSWSAQLDDQGLDFLLSVKWMRLVEEFTSKDMTYALDRVPAITGVMARLGKYSGWTPVWGMWKEHIVKLLAWKADSPSSYKRTVFPTTIAGSKAPSWSWTSVNGPISYAMPRSRNNPYKYEMKLISVDASIGELVVESKCVFFALRMKPRTSAAALEGIIYDISDYQTFMDEPLADLLKDGRMLPFHPDTCLRPYRYHKEGLQSSSIPETQRVPANESRPEYSFISRVYFLLLGAGAGPCDCLVVGRSERFRGSHERLGIIENVQPAIFKNAHVARFTIV